MPLLALLLAGCAANPTLIRAGQQADLPRYSDVKSSVPAQPEGTLRLYFYRPQALVGIGWHWLALVGMWGSAIVIVNGKWLGDRNNPLTDNRLIPGAVFVVDVPASLTRVWSYQSGRGEDEATALELSPAKSGKWYLRWSLKPTYGYLEPVEVERASSEMESLRFSGYVRLGSQ